MPARTDLASGPFEGEQSQACYVDAFLRDLDLLMPCVLDTQVF